MGFSLIELTTLQILQGILTLSFVVISTILGILFISKYFKYKKRELILFGITWILIVSPYWSDIIAIIILLFYGTILNERIYFLIAIVMIPVAHITWMIAFTDIYYIKKKKILLSVILIEAIIFEIFFIWFLITDITLIGTLLDPFNVGWAPFLMIYILFSIVLFVGTGLLFARKAIKSEKKEIRLKGIFLFIAFITFMIGGIFDAAFELTEITLILGRSFLIVSAFAFYIGFIMPIFIKKLFIKESEKEI